MLKGTKKGGNASAPVAKPRDGGMPTSNRSAPAGERPKGGAGPATPGSGKRPR